MIGQEQFGAVIIKVLVQLFNVDVSVTFVPAAIPLTVLLILFTVPALELTVPLLAKLML